VAQFISRVSIISLLAVYGLPYAQAQQAGQSDAAGDEPIEEIIITGSYIKSSTTTGALPISVLDRGEMEALGSPTTADIVNDMVINFGSENRSNPLGGQNRNTGTANVNLRGLGLDKTLVLFNGKRQVIHSTSAGSGASFVDINLIPGIAIDRIEVLKDGAAATYGSDAVAGVVNMITRTRFEGLELSASYRDRLESPNQGNWDISGIWGWGNDDTNFVVSAAYSQVDQLVASEMPFAADTSRTQLDANRGVSTLAGPGALILVPDFTDPTQVTNLTNYIGSFGPLAPVAQGLIAAGAPNIDPGCDADAQSLRFNIRGTTAPLEVAPGVPVPPQFGRCGYSFVKHYHLADEQEKINVWATLRSRISDSTEFYGEAAWYSVDVNDIGNSPSFPVLRFEIIPAENPGNFLGVDGIYLGRPFGQNFPTMPSQRQYDTYRVVGGLRVDFNNGWDLDTSVSYSNNNVFDTSPTILQQQFGDALRGLGGPNCDTATGTPGVGDCMWFNPFTTRWTDPALANDPAVEEFMRSSNDLDQTAELLVFDAVFTGDLWEMGAGTVRGAFGVQYRDEGLDVDRNPEATIPGTFIFVGGGIEIDETQDVYALFGELNVPLADNFEAQLALRYEDYGSGVGDTLDPKLALIWDVNDVLSFRGSASTTFRGPTLHQRFNQETNLIPFSDVPKGGGTPSTGFKAADTQGNPNLLPESATTFNVGMVIAGTSPFRMTLDYWNIDFEDVIAVENGQTKVTIENTLCVDRTPDCRDPDIIRNALPGEDPDDNLQHSGEIVRVIVPFINAPTVETDGIDVTASYAFELGGGTLTAGLDASYMLSYDIGGILGVSGGSVTTVTIDAVGNRNESNIGSPLPDYRANLWLDWASDQHNARVIVRHIDEYNDDKTANDLWNAVIDSFTTVDLHYSYTFSNERTIISANVTNIGDEDPPFADQDLNFEARTHDPFGRQYQLVFRHSFDF
jgi:outer membrane receptor protein involved in Fe transport